MSICNFGELTVILTPVVHGHCDTVFFVLSVPATEVFLLSSRNGVVLDERVFCNDYINLAHSMGVFLYDDLLAIVSLRYQRIHILQIRDSGNLVDVRAIGEYCREDDELFLNSSAQASGSPTPVTTFLSAEGKKQCFLFLYSRPRKATLCRASWGVARVKSFAENGLPPRFLIIDDGWQSINLDHENPLQDLKDSTIGSQMLCRLYRFKENEKFAKYQNGTMLRPDAPGFDQEKHDTMVIEEANFIEYLTEHEGVERGGLKALVNDLKKEFQGLDDVYVWHALCGAWGGIRPGSKKLGSDLLIDLYDSMHSYLSDSGITGVKVDVINSLEYVCEEYGGRVQLAKAYYDGLTKSIIKNFGGKGIIASMEQCNDFFFLATKQISMGRVVGLVNMFNIGGAVEFVEYKISEKKNLTAVIKIKGSGKFLAYSSMKPKQIKLNNVSTEFEWTSEIGLLKFEVPWTGGKFSDAHI
ncbi:hypothetical protein RD792_010501 [Penstemon davidsonii]|uniref:Galactinol--sucrose galactosyltransferase n=1 Tax=Penstemon davidsonii TaxID=160366 RepID=A0ABR0D232_9LAMI|nr:hypothetical protein RD792_010501 [Penstemon davidsonii]